jgi:peptidoglycan/xylan/chitin deacetylase (PgdA/CDA1 family)
MYIPVLMFHGVADEVLKVPYGFLLQPAEHFEACMQYVARNGFTTITLQVLYNHLKSNESLPRNPIVLTFDDGYLDNWVYVYPILKKYGLHGTIFVVSDFVDPSGDIRPNLDDVATKRISRRELKWWG